MSITTAVVGDIHGRVEIVRAVLKDPTFHRVVFLGDFLDSFTRSPEDQFESMRLALDAQRENPEQVTVLLGNHELSYFYPREHGASGWNRHTAALLAASDYTLDEFKRSTLVGEEDSAWSCIATHAGVNREWMRQKEIDFYTFESLVQTLNNIPLAVFAEVGYSRGGFHPLGGPLWNDLSDHRGSYTFRQVFGHTQARKGDEPFRKVVDDYCIDCLDICNTIALHDDQGILVPYDLEIQLNEQP